MTLEAIRYRRGQLDILDQLLLPSQSVYISVNDTKDAWNAIKKMQVTCSFQFLTFHIISVCRCLSVKSFKFCKTLIVFFCPGAEKIKCHLAPLSIINMHYYITFNCFKGWQSFHSQVVSSLDVSRLDVSLPFWE